MPLLKTVEKIFIGYSAPQASERDITKRVIREINDQNHHKNLQLFVCEYRQLVVDTIPLQHGINRVIESCDLAILLFGDHVGSGLAEEARLSMELLKTGRIHKLLPYVFTGGTVGTAVNQHGSGLEEIQDFYDSHRVLFYRIEDARSYEIRLREHIGQWLAEEEMIVQRQKDFLRRGLLARFAVDDVAFTDDIIAIRQRENGNLAANANTQSAYENYVREYEANAIMESPVEFYLVARHLREAVLNNNSSPFSRTEFINPIHQYLATIIRHGSAVDRDRIVSRLESWVEDRHNLNETHRGFAAFQLGMLQSRSSAEILMRAVENKSELQSVRYYSVHSLGMLRQRSMIHRLMQAHSDESSPMVKDALTNTILFMMGVVE